MDNLGVLQSVDKTKIIGMPVSLSNLFNQAYRNGYNLIDRPSGNCNFSENKQRSLILVHLKNSKNLSTKFELLPAGGQWYR